MDSVDARAKEDFNRARTKETVGRLLSLLSNERDRLLSLSEVRALLRPSTEVYRGMRTVPIAQIVGSEGRYQDFNRYFLPRHSHLRRRWESVDKAHHRQITLPAVTLYEIGGVYFVRDGNHRVSVARLQGVEFIDAEVISLGSRIELSPDMSVEDLRRGVIALEEQAFLEETRLDRLYPGVRLQFTATGRYDEIVRHVDGHKYFINLAQREEISFERALRSWYENVYRPVVKVIEEGGLLAAFPGRTVSDLYVWIVRHWDELKGKYGQSYPLEEAAADYRERFGRRSTRRLVSAWGRLFRRGRRSPGKP
ncbi:MAG: transcriptional regulator [Spirochaetales bacterium]|nr:transcriptional regulator [Spirochaetales bacterium]